MFDQPPPPSILNEAVYTFIDPAAGGPQSDYAVLSVTRHKGMLTVSPDTKNAGFNCTDRPAAPSPQRPREPPRSP